MRILRFVAVGILAAGVVRRALTVVFLVVGGTLVFTACGAAGGGARVIDSGGKHVLVGPPTTGGEDAAISGQVALVGDCLGIGSSVAIWPSGTTIASDDPLVIEVPNLGHVRVGDQVDGGGGSKVPGNLPEGVTIPDTCKGHGIVTWRPE